MPNITVTNLTAAPVYLTDLYMTLQAAKSVTLYRTESDLTRMVNLQQLKAAGTISLTIVFTDDEVNANLIYPIEDAPPLPNQSWFIDPVNGNDSNDGSSTAKAIKTNAELYVRLKGKVLSQNTTITWSSYPPISDPLRLDIECRQDEGQQLRILFQAPALTTKKSGTLSAVTALNRATNTPRAMTGTAFDSTDIGLRFLITSGARAGARGLMTKLNSTNNVRTGPVVIPDNSGLFNAAVTPVIGDPYEVQTAPGVMYIDFIRISGTCGKNNVSEFDYVQFRDFDFGILGTPGQVSAGGPLSCDFQWEGKTQVSLINCRFTDPNAIAGSFYRFICDATPFTTGSFLDLMSCYQVNVGVLADGRNYGNVYFDGHTVIGESLTFIRCLATLTSESLFQGPGAIMSPQVGSVVFAEDLGMMDNTAVAAIIVLSGSIFQVDSSLYGLEGLWGTSAGSIVGVSIADNSNMSYSDGTKLSITGASGDFSLGGRSSAEPFNTAASPPAYVASVACTWANLTNAAVGHNNMHDVTHNAHVFFKYRD